MQVITLNKHPDLLALAQHNPRRYPALFQSLGQPESQNPSEVKAHAQWDLLSIANGEQIVANHKSDGAFLSELATGVAAMAQPEISTVENVPSFLGGWVVYLGYELSDEIEPKLVLPATHFEFPHAFAHARRNCDKSP